MCPPVAATGAQRRPWSPREGLFQRCPSQPFPLRPDLDTRNLWPCVLRGKRKGPSLVEMTLYRSKTVEDQQLHRPNVTTCAFLAVRRGGPGHTDAGSLGSPALLCWEGASVGRGRQPHSLPEPGEVGATSEPDFPSPNGLFHPTFFSRLGRRWGEGSS